MFKGFQNTGRSSKFNAFPSLNLQGNNQAYGFSGCTFWLDASFGINTQVNLDPVTEWVDKIRGIKYIQATAGNQPRLITSNASFNNYPTVESQSGSRFMTAANNTGLLLNNEWTVAFIANSNAFNANTNVVLANSLNADFYFATQRAEAGPRGIGVYNANTILINSGIRDTSPHITVINKNEIVVDGVSKSTSSNMLPTRVLDQLMTTLNNSSAFALSGYLAEFIAWDSSFNSTSLVSISDNINAKYAIY